MSTTTHRKPDLVFTMDVLGRTLEHLGVQMYKRRDAAIAELVANCWDAGATTVDIQIPEPHDYDPVRGEIIIADNGEGMSEQQVRRGYMVVGRNRRKDAPEEVGSRRIMGRKGIGKLAGFGIASCMEVTTYQDGQSITFKLDVETLKREDNSIGAAEIPGWVGEANRSNGTRDTTLRLEACDPAGCRSASRIPRPEVQPDNSRSDGHIR